MLMIRLARFGAKKKPFYRVVVIEKERARNGRAWKWWGTTTPSLDPAQVVLKHDRIEHWTKNGAQIVRHRGAPGEEEPGRGAEQPAAVRSGSF